MATLIRMDWSDDSPINLSALDPDRDAAASSRLLADVMRGRRQRYPVRHDLLISVWTADRRALVGTAVMAALALVAVNVATRPSPRRPDTVVESLGVPAEFSVAAVSLQEELK